MCYDHDRLSFATLYREQSLLPEPQFSNCCQSQSVSLVIEATCMQQEQRDEGDQVLLNIDVLSPSWSRFLLTIIIVDQ